ncbi:hypothetical protein D3C86_1656820 [compost metagenome]
MTGINVPPAAAALPETAFASTAAGAGASLTSIEPMTIMTITIMPQYRKAPETPWDSIRLPLIYLKIRLPVPYAPTDTPEIKPLFFGNHLIRLDSEVI